MSTRDQHLVQQLREIRRAVDARGWKIVAVYRERRSGAAGVDRPSWRRLRHDAAMHRFSAVAAWSLDRLGRSALDVLDAAQDFEPVRRPTIHRLLSSNFAEIDRIHWRKFEGLVCEVTASERSRFRLAAPLAVVWIWRVDN